MPPAEPRYVEVGAVPLVALIEDERTPDAQVVSSYGTVYALAVYGPWMDGLETGVDDVRGFMPSWNDPRIVGIVRKDGPEEFHAALTDVINQVMTNGGYELAFEDQNRRSYLQLWARS